MGVKEYYDNFVGNFMTGSGKQQNDSRRFSESEPEAVELDEVPEVDSVRNPENEETGLTSPSVGSTASSIGQDDGPEVAGGGDADLRERVIAALREVYDPGLIYRLEIDSDHNALIDMTLTSPNCPVAGSLPGEIENAAQSADGIRDVAVELVWDPPWDMDRMGEAAKLELGLL
jgi:metal-sulfur cluster biosynthetic enzyme